MYCFCKNKRDWEMGVQYRHFLGSLKASLSFLRQQVDQIKEGGLPVVLSKLLKLLMLVPALAVIVIVRGLKPIVWIRFGPLASDRIGHFTCNTELYLCERDADMHPKRALDLLFYNQRVRVCNQQMMKMWDRTIKVSDFARYIHMFNYLVPGYRNHLIPTSDRDINGLARKTRPHLTFTSDEDSIGKKYLISRGLDDDDKFICLYARDIYYLDSRFPQRSREQWRYHDYRNVDINNYVQAAVELTRRGYFVFRMGIDVKEHLKSDNPMIIDYASNGDRTEFLDIYLFGKCYFVLGSGGGPMGISAVFRRPIASVDYIPLEYWHVGWGINDIQIPKKLWLKEKKRFLTFREIIDVGAGRFLHSQQYEQLGIEVIENTPEEVTALAIEMDERLKGTWQPHEDDEVLQRRLWEVLTTADAVNANQGRPLHGEIRPRFGARFLRNNRELLRKARSGADRQALYSPF